MNFKSLSVSVDSLENSKQSWSNQSPFTPPLLSPRRALILYNFLEERSSNMGISLFS